MSLSDSNSTKELFIEPFMLEEGDQSSPIMTNLLLVSLIIAVVSTLISVLLKKDFGYIPHIMGLLSILFYVLHVQYVYHRIVDPKNKCITLYSGRRGKLKPTLLLRFEDIHCVALDFKVVRGDNNTSSKSYYELTAIDKKGKKFDLSFTERWKCPVLLHKAETYASIFGVPFIDTETSIGFSTVFDQQGNVMVIPIDAPKLHKWAQSITYIFLFGAIMLCAWSFFIM